MKKFYIVALVSCYSFSLFSADRLYINSLPNPQELNQMKYMSWFNMCNGISDVNREVQMEKLCAQEIGRYVNLIQSIAQEQDRSRRNNLWNEANNVLDSMIVKAEAVLKKEICRSSAMHFSPVNHIK